MRSLKKLLAITLVLALAMSLVLPAMAKPIADYTDADAAAANIAGKGALADRYETAVQFAIDLGVIVGDHTGTLNLSGTLNRQDFAVMLYKAMNGGLGIEENPHHAAYINMPAHFNDTKTGSVYPTAYLNWFAEQNIAAGRPDGSFGVGTKINLMDAMLLTMKALGMDTDVERGYTYGANSIKRIANELQLGSGAGVYGTFVNGEELLDRSTACLLLTLAIESPLVGYWRGDRYLWNGIQPFDGISAQFYGRKSWARDIFGLERGNVTVLTDGAWFGIDGDAHVWVGSTKTSLNTFGGNYSLADEKVFIEWPIGWDYKGDPVAWDQAFVSAEMAEAAGFDLEAVGQTYSWLFKYPPRSGRDRDIIAGQFRAPEAVTGSFEKYNIGAGITADIQAGAGDKVKITADTRWFWNYTELNDETDFQAAVSGTAVDSWSIQNELNSLQDIKNLSWSLNDCNIRTVYDDYDVKYVFFEYYTYNVFDIIVNGKVYETIGTSGINGKDSWKVRGVADLKAGDRFLSYEIGADRYGVFKIDASVQGKVTRFLTSDHLISIGGTDYINSFVAGISDHLVNTMVTQEWTLYLFNGNIVDAAIVSGATQYAVVSALGFANDAYGTITSFSVQAKLVLADGTTLTATVNKANDTTGSDELIFGAISESTVADDTNRKALRLQFVDTIVTYSGNEKDGVTINELAPTAGDTGYETHSTGWSAATVSGRVSIPATAPVFVKDGNGWKGYEAGKVPMFLMVSGSSAFILDGNVALAVAIDLGSGKYKSSATANWAIFLDDTTYGTNKDGARVMGIKILKPDGKEDWLYAADPDENFAGGHTFSNIIAGGLGRAFRYEVDGDKFATALDLDMSSLGGTAWQAWSTVGSGNFTSIDQANRTIYTADSHDVWATGDSPVFIIVSNQAWIPSKIATIGEVAALQYGSSLYKVGRFDQGSAWTPHYVLIRQ